MDKHNCFNCRFLLRFTPKEAETFSAKLAQHGLQGDFFGGCIYKWPGSPFVIRRYLDHPISGCIYWEQGYFREPLGMPCPQCHEGQIVIHRPVRDKQTYILIRCSRYPYCTFNSYYLPLEKSCHFCKVQLLLAAGEQLVCFCPKCKRSAVVTLTFASWPHLLKVGPNCPHGYAWGQCEVRNHSRAAKVNVVDLELPIIASYWLKKQEEQKKARGFFKKERAKRLGEQIAEDKKSEFEQEIQELKNDLLNNLDKFTTEPIRAQEEGWLYKD